MRILIGVLTLVFSVSLWAQKIDASHVVSCDIRGTSYSFYLSVEAQGLSHYTERGLVSYRFFSRQNFIEVKRQFNIFSVRALRMVPSEDGTFKIIFADVDLGQGFFLRVDVKGPNSVIYSNLPDFSFNGQRMKCSSHYSIFRPGVSGGN